MPDSTTDAQRRIPVFFFFCVCSHSFGQTARELSHTRLIYPSTFLFPFVLSLQYPPRIFTLSKINISLPLFPIPLYFLDAGKKESYPVSFFPFLSLTKNTLQALSLLIMDGSSSRTNATGHSSVNEPPTIYHVAAHAAPSVLAVHVVKSQRVRSDLP